MDIRRRLQLSLLLIGVVLLLGAVGFHFLEGWPWFDGLYMTLVTMTTVGYGETHPLSPVGRVFNTFILLASVLSGGFLIATFTQAMLEFELAKFVGRRRMEREIARLQDHYIICGAGRVGRTVAHELMQRGASCVVIEKDPLKAEWAVSENVPVIVGSATGEAVLRRSRIESAKGLIAAVTSDAENLYIVLTASGLRSDLQIIARASEEEAIPKLLRAGAAQVLSPYHFVGQRIVQLLLKPNVLDFIDTAFGMERMDIRIEELRLPEKSPFANLNLARADIRSKTGVLILAVKHRDGSMEFNPSPDTVIHPGDYLIAIGSPENLQKLERMAGV